MTYHKKPLLIVTYAIIILIILLLPAVFKLNNSATIDSTLPPPLLTVEKDPQQPGVYSLNLNFVEDMEKDFSLIIKPEDLKVIRVFWSSPRLLIIKASKLRQIAKTVLLLNPDYEQYHNRFISIRQTTFAVTELPVPLP